MTIKLFIQAMLKFLLGLVLVGLLIFLPAGSLLFINGWILMGILFIPMFVAGLVMMFKNPDLLKKRLDAKEKQNEQSLVVKLSGLMFLAGFVVAAFAPTIVVLWPNAAIVCCAFVTVPQTEHFLPSVRPVAVQVAALPVTVTSSILS